MKYKMNVMTAVSVAALFIYQTPATAQQDKETDNSSVDVEELLIKARVFRDPSDGSATKLNIPLSETAGQVLVLTEDFNDALGNLSVLDTIDFLPGVTNTGTIGNDFFLLARGFGLNNQNGFRLNGAPLGGAILFDQSAISRFEYIKGAQAAAYGQISAAGFINLGLKEAGDRAAGNLQVRVDNNGGIRTELTYGGPLNDAGTIRLLGSVAREQSDLQFNNNNFNLESNSAYLNIAVDLTDRLTSKAYLYYDDRQGPIVDGPSAGINMTDPQNPDLVLDYVQPDTYYVPHTGYTSEAFYFQSFTQYDFDNGHKLTGSFAITDSSLDNRWALPNGFIRFFDQLVNLTPGATNFGQLNTASSGRRITFFREQVDTLTRYAEIRYTGDYDITDNAVLNFIVSGEHYFNEAIGIDVGSNRDALPETLSLTNPVYNGGDPFNVPTGSLRDVFQDSDQKVNSISVLFSLDLYDRLRLNGGIRHDDYRGRDGIDEIETAQVFSQGTQSYSASVAYDVTEEITAYYAYSQGFEFVNELTCAGNVAPPERNRTHELGVKFEPNPGLLGSVALFDNSATDSLIGNDCPDGSLIPNGAVIGDGEQTGRGIELELIGAITSEWSFGGGISYVDDAFDFDIAFTPKWSLSFFTTYDFADGHALEKFSLGGGIRASFGRDVDRVNFNNFPAETIPDTIQSLNGVPVSELIDDQGFFRYDRLETGNENFVLVDASIAYDFTDNIQFQLNARNLFNKYYLQRLQAFTSGIIVGEPRTVLGTVNFNF